MQKGFFNKVLTISLIALIASCSPFLKGSYTPAEKLTLADAQAAEFKLDYSTAIQLYRTVYNEHRDDAYLNYKMGEMYFNMNEMTEAITFLDLADSKGAGSTDANFHLTYGLALQKSGNYKKALDNFEKFSKSAKKDDLKYSNVNTLISQCQYAVKAKENPVGAVITNIGDSINTQYTDYRPSISADGKTMIFTSARPEGKGGLQVKDGKYFEDVYVSKFNQNTEKWSTAEMLEGAVNTKEHDANVSISPDGKSIYLYKNIQSGKEKTAGGDIYVSTMSGTERWAKPKEVKEINSSYFEGSACISMDGTKMFFTTELSDVIHKNYGQSDIFMIQKDTSGKWSAPKNLGNIINTFGDETGIFLHPDGKTLFFASNGQEESMGGYDIYKTVCDAQGVWSKPVNLGYPINTNRDEAFFVLSTDGQTGYYATQRVDGRTDGDIYQIDLKHYNVLTGENSRLAILKGVVEDAATGKLLSAEIKITDEATSFEYALKSKENGEYFYTLASGRKCKIEVSKPGFKTLVKEVTMPLSDKKSIKELDLPLSLERETPLEVVSRDLFRTQHINFDDSDSLKFSPFSASIALMYIEQLKKAPTLKLVLTGHASGASEDEAVSLAESQKVAEFVTKYFIANGVKAENILVKAVGSDAPLSETGTKAGHLINKRVDVELKEN